jgi:nitroreductase
MRECRMRKGDLTRERGQDQVTGGRTDTLEVIRSRRSVRSFGPKPIPEADLVAIVEAGLLAPSARNQQKWHFSVVTAGSVLDRLAEALKEQMLVSGIDFLVERARTPGYRAFYGATAIILISADSKAPWIDIDCGAAAENMALAAEALGLGSCLMVMPGRLFAADEDGRLARELGFPEGYTHVVSVALGYREGERPAVPARKGDVVSYVRS